MNYKGTIIEESLVDTTLLQEVKILETKVEPVTERHKTPWLTRWTLHSVEIPEEQAETFAQKVSKSFDQKHPNWYVDYKNNTYHFIVFSNKIFKVDLHNPLLYQEAKQYGISLGIPDYQMDFVPK